MQNCLNCLEPVALECIQPEVKLSFEYENMEDLIEKLDKTSNDLKEILTKNIDKKWLKEDRPYIVDYIQDIINKVDTLLDVSAKAEPKYKINSELTAGEEKSSLQLFTLLLREVEALKKKSNSNTSSLYTPHV